MTPPPQPDDRDPVTDYVNGVPDAVRAARPPEPSEATWDAVLLRIHSRLAPPSEPRGKRRRGALWVAVATTLTTAAAAVAWVALGGTVRPPDAPVVVGITVVPEVSVAPAPHEPRPDPLAEFAVLPMASTDEVVLHRVPGDGLLPVGSHPLPGALSLATTDEVQLDDPDDAWAPVAKTPAHAPMIFAAKPR